MTPEEVIKFFFDSGHYWLGGVGVLAIVFKKQVFQLVNGMLEVMLAFIGRDLVKKVNLVNHPFFIFMETAKLRLIDKITFDNKTKQFLLRTFLKLKFQTFHDNFMKMVKDENHWKKSPKEYFTMQVLTVFINSIVEYNEKARAKFKELGLDNEMIDLIIDKFNFIQDETIELIEAGIKDTCQTDFYATNKHRLAAVLFKIKMGFEMTVNNGKKTFTELNGKLDGVKLKSS